MNLYKLTFTHYAPKDSETGIIDYLLANNDDEVYDYISTNHAFWIDNENYEKEYYENYDEEEYGFKHSDENGNKETFRQNVIRNRSDNEANEPHDTYYGFKNHGWELLHENISPLNLAGAIILGIIKQI